MVEQMQSISKTAWRMMQLRESPCKVPGYLFCKIRDARKDMSWAHLSKWRRRGLSNKYLSASSQPWHASAGPPMGCLGSFLVMALWFGLTVGRTGLSVREPPDADRQLALLPVGLSATILPYPFFLSLFSSSKR